ncbi:MAG: hypothetical protein UY72_C0008G0008 [Candidatus Uhrbacteria bacterium GW2011_GWD2_52_7]|uniref:Protein TolB n=1 Tax=Candidatus Uhrbacteria bacterium GW2011_GWD2_52_7 TaxID=1618989 RepID=A0A0G1XI29_9BACT|nr:MAG: hypothetical protein UY72_C0008G0008 [Candidatus Uhrbacteria bacterium GW2011_GWD2_52_7]
MSERTTFILKLLAILAATGLLGFALYFVFFRQEVPQADEVVDEGTQTVGGLPSSGLGGDRTADNQDGTSQEDDGRLPPSEVADGGATFTNLLTSSRIVSPTVTATGAVAYYDPADGRFYTIDTEGNVVELSRTQFPQAESVVFADNATAAVIEFPDGSNVIYDFNAAKQVSLPNHWEEFSFTDDGSQVVGKSIGSDESNRALIITSTDGSGTEVIASLGNNDEKVDVNVSPSNTIVGFSRTGGVMNAFGRQEIYLIGLDGEASGVLIVDGSSFSGIWSPDGAHLLYSVANPSDDYRAALWYVDSQGDRKGDIRLNIGVKTTVDKCTFASTDTIYCAVPREMPAGGGSDSSSIDSYDDVYKISLPSGRATLIAIPAADTRMYNLRTSDDAGSLYYTDSSGRLNYIRLK